MCAIAGLVILALGAAVGWQVLQQEERRRSPTEEAASARALHILEERYARGEIGQQEFEERRRTLQGR